MPPLPLLLALLEIGRLTERVIILVHSTSHAVAAERVLRRAGLRVRLIPTPRELSSDCGSALEIAADDRAVCQQALQEARVPIDRIEVLS